MFSAPTLIAPPEVTSHRDVRATRCCGTVSLPNHRPQVHSFCNSVRRRSMDHRQLSKTLRFALSVAVVALLCGGAIGSASRFQSQSNSAFDSSASATNQSRDPSHPASHHSNGQSPRSPLAQFQRLHQARSEVLRFLRLLPAVGARHGALAASPADHRPHPAGRRERDSTPTTTTHQDGAPGSRC